MKISFIIPAYNATSTIRRCLDSIYFLPLKVEDFEVIVIDDCSTDNTVEFLLEYTTIHKNLTIIKQPRNSRQGAARNIGMNIAKGDYIMFLDSDDEIVPEGIINALDAVRNSNVDICYFDFIYENPKSHWQQYNVNSNVKNRIISSYDYLNQYYNCEYNAPWRCLYKRTFLNGANIKFVEGVRWEDADWTVKVYLAAANIQFVDGVGYKYYYGENATSRQKTSIAMYERVFSGIRLLEIAETCNNPGLFQTLLYYTKYVCFNELRLRNLTKYPYRHVKDFLSRIDKYQYRVIKKYSSGIWIKNVLSYYHKITLVILYFACPIAQVGRQLVNFKRQIL